MEQIIPAEKNVRRTKYHLTVFIEHNLNKKYYWDFIKKKYILLRENNQVNI